MMLEHPHAELSAYIDGALDAAARAAVVGHLAACAACRARVAQLRATASLIRSLPDPVPSRRLVPRLTPPAWLAPLRTLMTLASGAAAFLFVASAVVSSLPTATSSGAATTALESTRDRAAQAPAPRAPGAQVDAASPTGTPTPTAAPGAAAFGLGTSTAAPAQRGTGATQSEAAQRRLDQASPTTAAAAPKDTLNFLESQRPQPPSPWLWLAIAIACGAIALALHRRLHASI